MILLQLLHTHSACNRIISQRIPVFLLGKKYIVCMHACIVVNAFFFGLLSSKLCIFEKWPQHIEFDWEINNGISSKKKKYIWRKTCSVQTMWAKWSYLSSVFNIDLAIELHLDDFNYWATLLDSSVVCFFLLLWSFWRWHNST